jgi:hypothetical protein
MLAAWVAGLLHVVDGGAVVGAFSPDGGQLALVRTDGRVSLRSVIAPSEDTVAKVDGVPTEVRFLNDQTLLVAAQHLYRIDVPKRAAIDLTPWAQTAVTLVWQRKDQALVSASKRAQGPPDVFRVTLDGAASTLEVKHFGQVTKWVPDAEGSIRAALSETRAGDKSVSVRDSGKAQWRTLVSVSSTERLRPIAFTWDGVGLFLETSVASDTSRVVEKHVGTGAERLLAREPQSDVRAWWLHPAKPILHAVAFEVDGGVHWQALESAVSDDVELLSSLWPSATPVGRDPADTQWLVEQGGALGHFDRRTKKVSLFDAPAPLPPPPGPVAFQARDGVPLTGWLWRGADGGPLVVATHDSTSQRLSAESLPELTAALVTQGLSVLLLNGRGVMGYGKQRWAAGASLTQPLDILDAASWAESQGIGSSFAVWGAGLGASVALAAMQAQPTRIRCVATRDLVPSTRAVLPARFVRSTAGEPWKAGVKSAAWVDASLPAEKAVTALRICLASPSPRP